MCEQREHLLDYLYDEITPTARREMDQHLEACDDCRDDLRAFRRVREDLLAWDVPQPAPVWKPFAPAPVVPWFRQVPAWGLAAAASLMFMIGAAGGGAMVAFGGFGQPNQTALAEVPAVMTAGPSLDADAISALIRKEVSSATADATAAARMTTVANHTPASLKLDPASEQRLVDRASELMRESEKRVYTYLVQAAIDADRQRRDDGQRMTQLQARVDELQAYVNQLLVLQQAKVQ